MEGWLGNKVGFNTRHLLNKKLGGPRAGLKFEGKENNFSPAWN
jgi:hypothetical protein